MAPKPNEEALSQKLVDDEEPECTDWDAGSDDDAAPPPVDPEKGRTSSANAGEKADGSVCVAVCTLLAAVPALIGSWCWPILVGAIFAVAAGQVNGGLVSFFHGVQVAVMFALMTNIVQFAYWNVQKKRKKQGHWYMYRPVYLLMVSTVLVCLQPVCMLIIGSWKCDGQFSADQLDSDWSDGAVVNSTGYFKDGSFAGYYGTQGVFKFTKGNDKVVGIPKNTFYPDGCSSSMQNFFFDGGVSNALVPNTTTGWMIQIFGTYLGFIMMFVGVCQATMLHVKIAKKWAEIRGE